MRPAIKKTTRALLIPWRISERNAENTNPRPIEVRSTRDDRRGPQRLDLYIHDGSFGTGRLWINGQPATHSNNDDAATPEQATSLEVLSVFEGEADEAALYDKALTPGRVLAHYLAGKP